MPRNKKTDVATDLLGIYHLTRNVQPMNNRQLPSANQLR